MEKICGNCTNFFKIKGDVYGQCHFFLKVAGSVPPWVAYIQDANDVKALDSAEDCTCFEKMDPDSTHVFCYFCGAEQKEGDDNE